VHKIRKSVFKSVRDKQGDVRSSSNFSSCSDRKKNTLSLKEKKQVKIDVDLPSLNSKVHFSGEDTFVIPQQSQTYREDYNKSGKKVKHSGTINS